MEVIRLLPDVEVTKVEPKRDRQGGVHRHLDGTRSVAVLSMNGIGHIWSFVQSKNLIVNIRSNTERGRSGGIVRVSSVLLQ